MSLNKKLQNIESIPKDFIVWLCSYLQNRKQKVVINKTSSNITAVTSGVPQGSILGPYLFSLFVNDLKTVHACTKLMKYSDDTNFLVPVFKNSIDSNIASVIDEITNMKTWSATNNMTINMEKSKILYFKTQSPLICLLPSEIVGINVCNMIKLLGITFNERMCFDEYFNAVITKASQRLHFLRLLKKNLTKQQLWNVYNSLIRSLLEYAAPIFIALPSYLCDRLEKLQNRAHNIICGYTLNDNYHRERNCDCVVKTLKDRRIDLSLKLFKSVINNELHPLAKLDILVRNDRGTLILPHIRTKKYRDTFFNACTILINDMIVD